LTLAALFPLYARIATKKQADAVARRIERDFLKAGGLVTSLVENGQQWDAPNGWAPLQWIAIEGLRNYGHHSLANEIKQRWVKVNMKVFLREHKLIEKYNVTNSNGIGGGGSIHFRMALAGQTESSPHY
jgi:alpha,alpha-trehalase